MPRRKGDCFLCGKVSEKRCDKCKLVFSCSREHYKLHHQKDYCFPFRINWKPMGGGPQSIIATRDIKPLELILFEEALTWGPSSGKSWSPQTPVCSECLLSKDDLVSCGLCGLPVCDDMCQVGLNHNIECQVLRSFRSSEFQTAEGSNLATEAILTLRLLKTRYTNSKLFARCQFLLQRKLTGKDLEEKFADDNTLLKRREKLLKLLKAEFARTGGDSQDLLTWAFDICSTQAVAVKGVTPGGGHKFGAGIFPLFSVVSHSCIPNSKFAVYPEPISVALQSKVAISKGCEITVSLVPTLEPTWKRRERIFNDRFMWCQCPRCEDASEFGSFLSAMRCDTCDSSGGVLPVNPLDYTSEWTCNLHPMIRMKSTDVFNTVKDLHSKLYTQGLVTTLSRLQECMKELEDQLHSHHALTMASKRFLIQCFTQLPSEKVGEAEHIKMKKLCEEQLEVLEKVDPGFAEWKGDLLKHLSTAELNLARLDVENGKIERAQFLTRVRKAMSLVQEGLKCKSCVKIDRGSATLDEMVSELSDSSYMSDTSIKM